MRAVFALVAVLAVSSVATGAVAQNITDVDILNFALNLEYLEAEFYSWAVFGKGLSSEQRGGGPASSGGKKANLTGNVLAYATEIANDEIAHVEFLRTALGDAAVPMPKINIGTPFRNAARAAFMNNRLSPNFSPYANDLFFMHGAFIFEDVGVTAYKGAAALITDKTYLTAAAGILAVEAYHAGVVRSYLAENANVSTPYSVNVSTIVDAISALRTNLSGLPADSPNDFGVYNASSGDYTLVPVDANGIVYSRTPQQVVSIVTFGNSTGAGGFFPNGLNGAINATLMAGEAVAVGDSTPSGSTSAPSPAEEPAAAPGSAAGAPSESTPAPTSDAATSRFSAAVLVVAAFAGSATLLLA